MPNTTNDALLWYNVEGWDKLGLAVPNWSNDIASQNMNIIYLTRVMGRNLQALMFHDDAMLTTPPSINTLTRIHKLCIRARDIMSSRAVPENEYDMESAHANPAPEVFTVFPTRYFLTRNQWLRDYCGLILTALTEAMQHQENVKAIEISTRFAALIGQYLHRVYVQMSIELFLIPKDEAHALGFTLTEEQLRSYNPSSYFTGTEMIDTVPPLIEEPTEDTLYPITRGIPVTMLPDLGRWPIGGVPEGPAPRSGASGASSSFEGMPPV